MNCVPRPRWNEIHVHSRPRGPRVALVDWVTMLVNQHGMVEMRARLDWPAAPLLSKPAPKNHFAIFILRKKFQPATKSTPCPAGKKMSHKPCPHHDVHAFRIAPANFRAHTIERRSNRNASPSSGIFNKRIVSGWRLRVGFLSDRKCGRESRLHR